MTGANPADALLNLFATWDAASGSPEQRRKAGSVGSPEFWRQQNRAAALLEECERLIDEVALLDPQPDTSVWRVDLVNAYLAVFGYQPRWAAPTNRAITDDIGLRRLAGLFRRHLRTRSPDDSARSTLQTALEEVRDEIDQAGYLADEDRAYLLTLVDRALGVVRDETSTDQAVRAVAHETAGALVNITLVQGMPSDKKNWFRQQADIVATAVLTAVGTAIGPKAIDAVETGIRLIESAG